MKIGVVLDEYVPQDGGAFTMQGEILSAIVELAPGSNHQFEIVSLPDQELAEQLRGSAVGWSPYGQPGFLEKVSAFIVRTWPNLRNSWQWQSSFEKKARQRGIEFLWFLGQRPQDVDLPYLAIVLDLQHRLQPWFPEVSQFGQWETRERGFARHLRRAAAIIAGTQAGRAEVTRFYQIPEERIHILPHPTPGYALNAEKKASSISHFGLQPGYLFYPAQFWAHKNHVNLLLALKILADEGLNLELVLAGSDFGNKQFVKEQAEKIGVSDQVKFVDFVNQEDLIGLYQNALALTYLSFFGPENLPPLEAFALGCPVIAAQVSGSEEQLGEAAVLVDPKDPRRIAEAIRKVHTDKSFRETLIAKGLKRAGSWTAKDFVLGAFKVLDEFSAVRRNWK
jgi:glycosyltransferase involved in cell wall biosynthesis